MLNYRRRALISVFDKTGLEPLVRELYKWGIEIVSTGGTAKAIEAMGIKCTSVSDVTGFPEIMDGRVKTLHPKIHGAILKMRGNQTHEQEAEASAIGEFDLVVVNLYPFATVAAKPNATTDECLENIDIGGPAMIRSAAKNFRHVRVVVDPTDYGLVIRSLRENDGQINPAVASYLFTVAFRYTAEYDATIATWAAETIEYRDLV